MLIHRGTQALSYYSIIIIVITIITTIYYQYCCYRYHITIIIIQFSFEQFQIYCILCFETLVWCVHRDFLNDFCSIGDAKLPWPTQQHATSQCFGKGVPWITAAIGSWKLQAGRWLVVHRISENSHAFHSLRVLPRIDSTTNHQPWGDFHWSFLYQVLKLPVRGREGNTIW